APYFDDEGDQVFVRAGATGAASIVADAPDTTTTIPITIVGPADLTSITQSVTSIDLATHERGVVRVGALVGTRGVYGAQCTWNKQLNLNVALEAGYGPTYEPQTGWLGVEPRFAYTFEGFPGTYQETCTMPGGLSTTIAVTIHP